MCEYVRLYVSVRNCVRVGESVGDYVTVCVSACECVGELDCEYVSMC